LFALIGIVSLLFGGCQTTQPAVVAATGTIFGLEVSQNAASQTPQLKLGYNRAEIAIVSKEKFGDDVANVLMEFNYGGGPSYSIYQRLAVGRTAVQQAGASAMFIKDASGNLSPEAAKQIKDTINAIK
jgi:hypothetical protein